MKFLENIKLGQYTTFKIGGPARFFCIVKSDDDVIDAVKFGRNKNLPFFVLGGGSNILVADEGYRGLVIKNEIGGMSRISTDNTNDTNEAIFSVGAGESWDDFVKYSVEQGYGGVENLSSIPGVVGAAPVQNIGAYGVDVSGVIETVHAYDTAVSKFVEFSRPECEFEYRNSIFKKNKGRYIITRVDFVLKRNGRVNLEYKDLKEYFCVDTSPTLQEVRNAVIEIRANKLPDWKVWGTAGSFFKNPIIGAEKFAELKTKYPSLPGFPEEKTNNDSYPQMVKISLGWFLDKVCNAKGLTIGNAGTYEKQALVLVSKPGATATEVLNLSKELMDQVKEKTGIDIEA